MNAAVGAAAADVQVTDWMYAALPPQIVNEPWELQGALEVLWEFFAHFFFFLFLFFLFFFCAGTRQVWRGGTTGVGDYESILG